MKYGVLYARVSSKEQGGFSVPAQRKFLKEYAEKHDIRVVQEFIEARTAKEAGRKRFDDMVSFLRVHSLEEARNMPDRVG